MTMGDKRATVEQKQLARFSIAESCRRNLVHLGPPEYPDRPIELPPNDVLCLERVRASESEERVDGFALAAAFGAWRYEVWQAEENAKGRVKQLLDAWKTYRDLAAETGGDTHLEALQTEVAEFLRANWDIDPDSAATWEMDEQRLLRQVAQRPDVLPQWLGALADPPAQAKKDRPLRSFLPMPPMMENYDES